MLAKMMGVIFVTLRQRASAANTDVAKTISAKSVRNVAQSFFFMYFTPLREPLVDVFGIEEQKVTRKIIQPLFSQIF